MSLLTIRKSSDPIWPWERRMGCDYGRGLEAMNTSAGQQFTHVVEPAEKTDHPCSGELAARHVNGYGRFILCQGHADSLGRD